MKKQYKIWFMNQLAKIQQEQNLLLRLGVQLGCEDDRISTEIFAFEKVMKDQKLPDGKISNADAIIDEKDIPFADKTLDFIFAPDLFKRIHKDYRNIALKHWLNKIKDGGALIMIIKENNEDKLKELIIGLKSKFKLKTKFENIKNKLIGVVIQKKYPKW